MLSKKTLIIGASEKEWRYSFLAVNKLLDHGHEVAALGVREGKIREVNIETGFPEIKDVDTITLYLSEKNQKSYYDYILKLKPSRIIFNPGAENKELWEIAEKNGIEPVDACTLVLLSTGQF
ncbi:MAG TPA: CoA-binding protein [Bacteroidia bacterium]|nr:CoA-binding protein [Bacteroidia bacterium]